jgi:6-phosphogluconolactonase
LRAAQPVNLRRVNGEIFVVEDVPSAFAEQVVDAFHSRVDEEFSMALSGGPTARACYEKLAVVGAEQIDWWLVNVLWSDERCVPADDPDSNQLLVRQALLEKVGAANAVYPMRCEEGPEPYQLRLGEMGRLDIVHLGLGPDGHTASLFADSPALNADPGVLVALNEDPSSRNPHRRMTLTLSGIARGRLVIVTVAGESKRQAMQAVVDGADVPAARIAADRVIWLVDPAAAPQGFR